MLIHSTRDPRWLSNSWLVGDRPGGHAVLIDSGAPLPPIVEFLEEHRLTLTHVLCTHHHPDHVLHNDDYRSRYGCPVCGHTAERELFGDLDVELEHGDELRSGELRVRALHTPGHTLGQLAYLIDERELFTGDTLFRGSIGGTRGRGHTTYEDIRASILDVLLALPDETVVRPGHMESTTVARELRDNPFVRYWHGKDAPLDLRCEAFGVPGRMLVDAEDYDGGRKCLVAFDDGKTDIVPGSRIRRL